MLYISSRTYVLLFIIILHTNDIVSAFWRYRKKSRLRPRLLEQFSFCHWNLNSITAHTFIKMSLLQAYNSIHNFDIICLLETYLRSFCHSDDDQVALPGCNLIRADNQNTRIFFYKKPVKGHGTESFLILL